MRNHQSPALGPAQPSDAMAAAAPAAHRPSVFSSFWLGGFESACHVNGAGRRIDMLAATQHDRLALDDYGRLRQVGIRSVRDTARWHLIEATPGVFDFSSLDGMLQGARRHGIQVVWDLCHYGWPDGLNIFAPAFVDRFARFCGAVARHVREQSDAVPLYTPVNEISFFSWAAGEVGWFAPYAHGRGLELKQQLVRACIAGIEAIWAVDPRARILTVEPLIHVVPAPGSGDVDGQAAAYRRSQFEAWDMLTGALAPQLGGDPRYLDLVGVNFYHDNQWEHPSGNRLVWSERPRDPRWMPFHELLIEVHSRYHRPVCVSETSHVGAGRGEWLREITNELVVAIAAGVPVEGVCLYPIIDRFEWDNPSHWHNSGLWDLQADEQGTLVRVLNDGYAAELWESQRRLAALGYGDAPAFATESA